MENRLSQFPRAQSDDVKCLILGNHQSKTQIDSVYTETETEKQKNRHTGEAASDLKNESFIKIVADNFLPID